MLPKDLLDVRRMRGRIYPRFAKGSKDLLLAESVIRVFKEGIRKKYGDTLSRLKSLESAENFRKVRGFANVLERFCTFTSGTHLEPLRIRLALFSKGFVTSEEERLRVLREVAEQFQTTPAELDAAMFADREEEMLLESISDVNAADLMKFYNLSLLQTVLFDALRLTFWTNSNHKEIFRRIKWLGLMYELREEGGKMLVEITGAASILKMTRKYGTAIAKLLPSVLNAGKWWLRAEILHENRIYLLELDASKAFLFPKFDESVAYDSSLEQEFAAQLRAINPQFEVIREPSVVKAGTHAFIPDFAVKIGGAMSGAAGVGADGKACASEKREVYIEIVGFWTPEYLRAKVEKVKKAKVPLIIIAREDYGTKFEPLEDVILFSKRIPYVEVARKIEEKLRSEAFELGDADVVNLRELAERHLVEMRVLEERALQKGYAVVGSYAIRKDVLERVRAEIDAVEMKKLASVSKILKKYGLSTDILAEMGYKICWSGLNFEQAWVKKQI